jgi:glycosyltransferase involved in cell wall biosynthesis
MIDSNGCKAGINLPKISVIIPVYNSERFLKKCIESIVNQSLRDIEIIFINDGSSDNSEKIIKEYACTDKRIKYKYQTNSGPGAARNNGITDARGEYLAFIDADDWIDKDLYETMYHRAIDFGEDIVFCDYIMESEKGKYISSRPLHKFKNLSKEKLIKCQLTGLLPWGAWHKIIRREIINKNNIIFSNNKNAEEAVFSLNLLHHSLHIGFVELPKYHYIQRMHSQSRINDANIWNSVLKEVNAALKNNQIFDSYSKSFNGLSASIAITVIYDICSQLSLFKAWKEASRFLNVFRSKYNINNVEPEYLMKRVRLMLPFALNGFILPIIMCSRFYMLWKSLIGKP